MTKAEKSEIGILGLLGILIGGGCLLIALVGMVNTAFNLTTMSYRGWLFLGLLVDRAAVADPDALLAAVDDAYSELLAAGGIGTRRTPDLSVTT